MITTISGVVFSISTNCRYANFLPTKIIYRLQLITCWQINICHRNSWPTLTPPCMHDHENLVVYFNHTLATSCISEQYCLLTKKGFLRTLTKLKFSAAYRIWINSIFNKNGILVPVEEPFWFLSSIGLPFSQSLLGFGPKISRFGISRNMVVSLGSLWFLPDLTNGYCHGYFFVCKTMSFCHGGQ